MQAGIPLSSMPAKQARMQADKVGQLFEKNTKEANKKEKKEIFVPNFLSNQTKPSKSELKN